MGIGTTPAGELSLRSIRGMYYDTLDQQRAASWAARVASQFDTDQPSEDYPWLGAVPAMTKWEGERTITELRSSKVTIVNDDWSTAIEFRRKDLRRDKTPQIRARVADLASRVAMHPEYLLTQLLTVNGNAYDGVTFFATNHAVGNSGTINNKVLTTDGAAGGAAPTTAQQANNILLGLQRMLGFKDDQGQPINQAVKSFAVMVPVNMMSATYAAVALQYSSAGVNNPLLAVPGLNLEVIVNARLTATDTFYLIATGAPLKPFLLQEELTQPEDLGPDSEHAKKTNKVAFMHGWTGGVGYGRFEYATFIKTA